MKQFLRIAFSTLCAALCALVIALWINSQWQFRAAWINRLEMDSVRGRLVIYTTAKNPKGPQLFVQPLVGAQLSNLPRPFSSRDGSFFICVPHWFLAQLLAVLTVLPWISWRKFTVKRLLLVTTYLAVLLGLAILSRR